MKPRRHLQFAANERIRMDDGVDEAPTGFGSAAQIEKGQLVPVPSLKGLRLDGGLDLRHDWCGAFTSS